MLTKAATMAVPVSATARRCSSRMRPIFVSSASTWYKGHAYVLAHDISHQCRCISAGAGASAGAQVAQH